MTSPPAKANCTSVYPSFFRALAQPDTEPNKSSFTIRSPGSRTLATSAIACWRAPLLTLCRAREAVKSEKDPSEEGSLSVKLAVWRAPFPQASVQQRWHRSQLEHCRSDPSC
ncbi:hypothetical protein FH972_021084 [Carpinus fangiana]|uniref:Uncharacterized protein n=1 Tax=Carpinus fangiana TaxID=176857 RepID=A0A5N6KNW0_9ROSI|nr:hypothetical protein FH972_021084 [Carpinus fangiana]